MATLPIETERLRIRHRAADDWHAAHTYTGDPGVMTHVPEGVIMQREAHIRK